MIFVPVFICACVCSVVAEILCLTFGSNMHRTSLICVDKVIHNKLFHQFCILSVQMLFLETQTDIPQES